LYTANVNNPEIVAMTKINISDIALDSIIPIIPITEQNEPNKE
jgi:hypothetical protein